MSASAKSLPDAVRTELLVACTAEGDRAREAWARWRAVVELDNADAVTQRLLPLLHRNLRAVGVPETADDMGRYHGHLRKAWVERRRLLAGVEPMLARFAAAGIGMVALKGLPLGERFYANPALRPAGDADVWVPRERATEAIEMLLAAGWRSAYGRTRERLFGEDRALRHGWEFYDTRGACLDLHWRALSLAGPPEWEGLLREYAEPFRVGGVQLTTLGATHHFYHVCLHGVTAGRAPTAHWAADAAMVWRSGAVDEALLVETARRHRTGRLLACAAGWVRERLGAGPAAETVAELAALPEASWAAAEFAALAEAEAGARKGYYRWTRFGRLRALDAEWRQGNAVAAYLRYLWLQSGVARRLGRRRG